MKHAIRTLNFKLNELTAHRDKCRVILRRKDQKGFRDMTVKFRNEATRKIGEIRRALKVLNEIEDGK